jgi:hypothetical protein
MYLAFRCCYCCCSTTRNICSVYLFHHLCHTDVIRRTGTHDDVIHHNTNSNRLYLFARSFHNGIVKRILFELRKQQRQKQSINIVTITRTSRKDSAVTTMSSSSYNNNSNNEIRIGTWNILSYDDEYDSDYGCPLSIAVCSSSNDEDTNTTTSNNTSNTASIRSSNRTTCIQQRYERVWTVLEELHQQYDVLCLQEVSDTFFAIQQQQSSMSMVSSNWTVLHRNVECALLLSKASHFQLVQTMNITGVPNLSGCNALPMVLLQQQQEYLDSTSSNSNSTTNDITYLVGSVHVQASVTNMSLWYQSAIDAILRSITVAVPDLFHSNESTNTNTNDTNQKKLPVTMIIIGGDFNQNLTSSSSTTSMTTLESPPNNWSLIAASPLTIPIQGTTQKEYNYMGNYDGFLFSTVSHLFWTTNATTISMNRTWNDQEEKNYQSTTDVWSLNVTNTSVLMKGFMPKVVYGFPQTQDVTIQETAQFAIAKTTTTTMAQDNGNNDLHTTNTSLSNFTLWNATSLFDDTMLPDDIQLLFSPASTFNYDDENVTVIVVPNSNPITESLSDHLLVSATFSVSAMKPLSLTGNDNNSTNDLVNNTSTTSSTNNMTTITNTTNEENDNKTNTTKSMDESFLSKVSPIGRVGIYIGIVVVLLVGIRLIVWKCSSSCISRQKSGQQHYDRSLTSSPHSIQ